MFKHLLVPTDGSDLSQATVVRAVSFAQEAGARLTFFYAEPESPALYAGVGAISGVHASQAIHDRLESAAKDVLDAAEQVARDAGIPYERAVLVGNKPYALIIQAAESAGCDLIFMASHGRRGLDSLLLGSETNKVLTHSKIPVLVFR